MRAPITRRSPTGSRSAADPATETLTYIKGRAGVPPLPEDTLTDDALVSVAELLRRYHHAASSFDPAGYAWPRPVPFRYRTGLVSHNCLPSRWPSR